MINYLIWTSLIKVQTGSPASLHFKSFEVSYVFCTVFCDLVSCL
jgi:hypothetical protein